MLSSSASNPLTAAPRLPVRYAKSRCLNDIDHQIRLREAQAKRKQMSGHNGKVVTFSAAHDSFCSSIGDLTFDGEGSSRHSLLSTNDNNPTDHTSQNTDVDNSGWRATLLPLFEPETNPSVDGQPEVPEPKDTECEHSPFGSNDLTGSRCTLDDSKPGKGAEVVKEQVLVRLSSTWRNRDEIDNTNAKPIKRIASFSPEKQARHKVTTTNQSTRLRVAHPARPIDLAAGERRSRSESDANTLQVKNARRVQRVRSAGDRPFQFLQRMKLKPRNSGTETPELHTMAHACEADKMMNFVAEIAGDSKISRHRPNKPDRKQRSKSRIESSKLMQMAHSVSPSKKEAIEKIQNARVGGERMIVSGQEDVASPRRKHRHMKKQRSKSLLCSSEITDVLVTFPESSTVANSLKVGDGALPIPATLTRRRRVVSMTAIDSPPRAPRRAHPGRKQPPTTSKSFDVSLARTKDEDWQIVSLDEESTTAASNGVNTEPVLPVEKQEHDMILLALERSLEDSRPPMSPSRATAAASGATTTRNDTGSLFWVKDGKSWVALPDVPESVETAEDEMLTSVLKSSVKEMMILVHLQLLGIKRPSLRCDVPYQ